MNARDFALLELDSRRLPGWKAGALLVGRRDREPPGDPRDLALADRIVVGVIKNHLLLMHLVRHYSVRNLNQIDPLIVKVLEIGLYQLRFMDRIPPSAAVDEAVEQCRRFGKSSAVSFVNAVLRRATRQPEVDLPDPQTDPVAHAATALSHPAELYRRLTKLMTVEDALRFCRHDNDEPPTLVRSFRDASVESLSTPGVTITPHELPGLSVVENAKRAILESWARRGLAQVQDATSASVVPRMDIYPGQRLLDRCAGLGTKTLQMREHLGVDGTIVAIDPSERRCAGLKSMLEARRITNVSVHQTEMLRAILQAVAGMFDRILVDVPCSNSGVLARRPEARYTQDAASIESLVHLQREILDDTAPHLVSGGLLVYSTCSVWPEENNAQVRAFVDRHPEYSPLEECMTLPSFDASPTGYHDGGFVAVLQRA